MRLVLVHTEKEKISIGEKISNIKYKTGELQIINIPNSALSIDVYNGVCLNVSFSRWNREEQLSILIENFGKQYVILNDKWYDGEKRTKCRLPWFAHIDIMDGIHCKKRSDCDKRNKSVCKRCNNVESCDHMQIVLKGDDGVDYRIIMNNEVLEIGVDSCLRTNTQVLEGTISKISTGGK